MKEVRNKLALVREVMRDARLDGVRFKGVDWFAWVTAGGDSSVLTTDERGVAEIVVTHTETALFADRIDGPRLMEEQLAHCARDLSMHFGPWEDLEFKDQVTRDLTGGGMVASDFPRSGEVQLPVRLVSARLRLTDAESHRYRLLCHDAACAMTDAMADVRPDWTERQLAARGAAELAAKGLLPAVLLVGGARRIERHRHPTPTGLPLGDRTMMAFCARRAGLVASLTRLVAFRPEPGLRVRMLDDLAAIEAKALAATVEHAPLSGVLDAMVRECVARGHGSEPERQHQGGLAGYRAREEIAVPASTTRLASGMAVAWNPSLPGLKLEDTMLLGPTGLEILTIDPRWPVFVWAGRQRPAVWQRP